MTVAWPSSIRPMLRASKSRSQPAMISMARPRRGLGYAQRVGSEVPVFWDMELSLTADEALTLRNWFLNDIGAGVDEFTMPIRTEFGMITHTCRFLPDGLLDATEDGQLWVYKARIMARSLLVPADYVAATALIVALPDWRAWAGLLDQTVTQEMPA